MEILLVISIPWFLVSLCAAIYHGIERAEEGKGSEEHVRHSRGVLLAPVYPLYLLAMLPGLVREAFPPRPKALPSRIVSIDDELCGNSWHRWSHPDLDKCPGCGAEAREYDPKPEPMRICDCCREEYLERGAYR